MRVSGVGQDFLSSNSVGAQYDRTSSKQDGLSFREEFAIARDSLGVSEEAKQASSASEQLIEFSKRACRMLRIRDLPEEDIETFRRIITDAETATNAKEFLKSLSAEERDVVKRANSYGVELSDSHIDAMSEEGARNLVVQPDYRFNVDLNNDGVVECGRAMTFAFPPPNAPEAVKDAWDKTMESLPEDKRLRALSPFMVQNLIANVRLDGNGEFQGVAAPGDFDYKNIFSTSVDGWAGLLDRIDEYLDFAEKNMPSEKQRIDEDRALIDRFRKNIFRAV